MKLTHTNEDLPDLYLNKHAVLKEIYAAFNKATMTMSPLSPLLLTLFNQHHFNTLH